MTRIPTIRSRLILLVLVCVIPASSVSVALMCYDYSTSRAQLIVNSTARARAMMATVDSEIAATQAALSGLATSPNLPSDDLAAFYDQAQSLVKSQHIYNIRLIGPGPPQVQRFNTLLPYGSELPAGVVPNLREAVDTGLPFASDLFLGLTANRQLVMVGVPVPRNGITDALAAGITPDQFLEILNRQRYPSEWIFVIIDGSGNIVARTNVSDRFIGVKAAPALLKRMAEVTEGHVETTSVEGIPVLGVFSTSATSHWTVTIGIPLASLTTPLVRTLLWLTGGMLVLLLMNFMLATVIGRRIALPIEALIGPALAIGKDDPQSDSPLNLMEAEAVRLALVEAALTLARSRHESLHDEMTGLPNRTSFDLVVHQQLEICRRDKTRLAVLYIDLDGFKAVNDAGGHAMGDELLRSVARRLQHVTRVSDMAARLGGDEFAIALIHADLTQAKTIADKLITTLSAPYPLGGLVAKISASVGVAGYPESATDSGTLLKRADQAMYMAKSLGKRRACVAPDLEGSDRVPVFRSGATVVDGVLRRTQTKVR